MSNAAAKLVTESPRMEATKAAPPPHIAAEPSATPPVKSNRARYIRFAVLAVALATAAYYGKEWLQVGRFQVSTDDAYVQTDTTVLTTKLPGTVKELPVAENTAVKAGDVVLRLDATDYELALSAAKARMETQKATIATIGQQIAAQQSQVAAVTAQLGSVLAIQKTAAVEQARASSLLKSQVDTQKTLDSANGALATASANVDVAKANIETAKAQQAVLASQEVAAKKQLDEMAIAVQKAQDDLKNMDIKAPFDGVAANRAVQLGQFVGAGSRLMAVVPLQSSYIEANFKETQLLNIHPGQKAEITVDALKGQTFEGKVLSVSPASGAEFSLLPPENATGNFTKITQRVPVKISVPAALAEKLRPGLSVGISVDLRDQGQ